MQSMPKKSVSEERKSQIMESLYKCLLKKQYHEITLTDIAATAGVNQGMIYYLYKKKEEVLLHFIDFIEERYRRDFSEYMNKEEIRSLKGKALIGHAMSFSNDRITVNRDLSKIFIEIWGIANHNKKVRKKMRHLYEQWISHVKGIIIKTGVSDEKAEGISNAMVSFYEGSSLISIILDWKGEQIKITLNDFQNRIMEMIDE